MPKWEKSKTVWSFGFHRSKVCEKVSPTLAESLRTLFCGSGGNAKREYFRGKKKRSW